VIPLNSDFVEVVVESRIQMDIDVDATPKPRRRGEKLPTLREKGIPTLDGAASESCSSRSNRSSRSTSPVKKMTDMRFFSKPIVMKLFDDETELIREDLANIHLQIHRFSREIRVISEATLVYQHLIALLEMATNMLHVERHQNEARKIFSYHR
jgi:hypothetical protein